MQATENIKHWETDPLKNKRYSILVQGDLQGVCRNAEYLLLPCNTTDFKKQQADALKIRVIEVGEVSSNAEHIENRWSMAEPSTDEVITDGASAYLTPNDVENSDNPSSSSNSVIAVMNPSPAHIPQQEFGILPQRQRNLGRLKLKLREKQAYECLVMGEECEYMMSRPGHIFKNVAEFKEDALRHLNPFQCQECGKRFGKRYGLERHESVRKHEQNQGQNAYMPRGEAIVFLSPQFNEALRELETVKKYDNVVAAFKKCLKFLDLPKPGLSTGETRQQTQRSTSQEDNILTAPRSTLDCHSLAEGQPEATFLNVGYGNVEIMAPTSPDKISISDSYLYYSGSSEIVSEMDLEFTIAPTFSDKTRLSDSSELFWMRE